MSRVYGTITTAIWSDPDFCSLDQASQLVYLMLTTQPEISPAGILPMTLRRWSRYSADASPEGLSDALGRLIDGRFVVVDWDREELLVRSFVKWDSGYKNGKRLLAIQAAAKAVVSPILGNVLAGELDRLAVSHEIQVRGTDAPSDGYRSDTEPPRSVVTYVSSTHTPQSTTNTPHATAHVAAKAKVGTRMTEDWVPSQKMIDWVRANCVGIDAHMQTLKFQNFWIAKSGKDATKLDWDRTYQNWMMDARPSAPMGGGSGPPRVATSDQRFQDGMKLSQRLAAQEADEQRKQIGA